MPSKRKRADGRAAIVRNPRQIRRALEGIERQLIALRERRRILREELEHSERRLEVARTMRNAGAEYADIGKRIGVTGAAVYALLNPSARKRYGRRRPS